MIKKKLTGVLYLLTAVNCKSKPLEVKVVDANSKAEKSIPSPDLGQGSENLKSSVSLQPIQKNSDDKLKIKDVIQFSDISAPSFPVAPRQVLSNVGINEQIIVIPRSGNPVVENEESRGVKVVVSRRYDSSQKFEFQMLSLEEDVNFPIQGKMPGYQGGGSYCSKSEEFLQLTPPMDGNGKFFEKSKPTRLYLINTKNGKSNLVWRKDKNNKSDLLPVVTSNSDCTFAGLILVDAETGKQHLLSLQRPLESTVGKNSDVAWAEKLTFLPQKNGKVAFEMSSSKLLTLERKDRETVAILTGSKENQNLQFFDFGKKGVKKNAETFWDAKEYKPEVLGGADDCNEITTSYLTANQNKIYFLGKKKNDSGTYTSICSISLLTKTIKVEKELTFSGMILTAFDANAEGNTFAVVARQRIQTAPLDKPLTQSIFVVSRSVGTGSVPSEVKVLGVDSLGFYPNIAMHHAVIPYFAKQGELLFYARPDFPQKDLLETEKGTEFPISIVSFDLKSIN